MTPREWAAERIAASLRWDDDTRQAYQSAVLYARALAGKLPPLQTLLLEKPKATPLSAQLGWLSQHLGVPFRKLSPEAKAAMERLKARG